MVDLERKRIFEQKEIKQIVRKRRKFEYSMVNKHVVKKDFLHYIEYEIAVECLRRQRSPQVQSVWTFLEKRLPDFLPRTNADFQHVFWKIGTSSEQKMS